MVALAALMAAGWWRARRAARVARPAPAAWLPGRWRSRTRGSRASARTARWRSSAVAPASSSRRAAWPSARRSPSRRASSPRRPSPGTGSSSRRTAAWPWPTASSARRATSGTPCATRVDRGGRGLATAVGPDGALYTTDGRGPFARVGAPGPVRAAAFTTRSVGALIRPRRRGRGDCRRRARAQELTGAGRKLAAMAAGMPTSLRRLRKA